MLDVFVVHTFAEVYIIQLHSEGLFTKYGSTGASTTDCDDNVQGNSSETTDEDDEELIPLRSEVESACSEITEEWQSIRM